ncbi:MAG: right-handed parallel beta-helix repeat-containing protein [Saprospiraceae bacterium]
MVQHRQHYYCQLRSVSCYGWWHGLSTTDCDNITIQNNTTAGRASGILVNNSIVSTISGNTLTNNFNNGINVSNGQNCTITNNTFTNCGTNGNTPSLTINGVATDGTQRLSVVGNTFVGGKNGISLANMDALTIANTGSPEVLLPDNDGKATLTGTVIALSNIDNTTIANFDLSAATFGGTALSTFNCDNITIQNNNATNRSAGIMWRTASFPP